jgi:hypothetical protein
MENISSIYSTTAAITKFTQIYTRKKSKERLTKSPK